MSVGTTNVALVGALCARSRAFPVTAVSGSNRSFQLVCLRATYLDMVLSDLEDGQLDSSPERNEDAPVYCICKKSDSNRFMICCDKCEKWFHGDCISITPEQAKRIQKFFCIECLSLYPDLKIVYKGPPKRKIVIKESEDEDDEYKPEKKAKTRRGSDSEDDDDEFKIDVKPSSKNKNKQNKPKSNRGRKPKEPKAKAPTGARRGRKSKESLEEREGFVQCLGPQCIQSARPQSKYCSDECGLKLATSRLYEILPQRIKQWQNIPSFADELNQRQLEKIRQEQAQAKTRLEELDRQLTELDQLISRSKNTQIYTEEEATKAEEQIEGDGDLTVSCVTCGTDINNRQAMRHMERCFSKHEAQSSLGSAYKTKIENLFCDVYNAHQRTYCKRLRTLCPEHSKDPKIGDNEVCGFPIVQDVFEETSEFCRFTKKRCTKHHGWEKIRRALIDMERVQQWLKIDDLFEKEQKTRMTMACRGGVPGIMLHQTTTGETCD